MDLDSPRAKKMLWDYGGKKFFRCRVSQYPVDLLLWEVFLNLHSDIRSIIEIGSQDGGSSLFLALQSFQRGIAFRTFDIVFSPALATCFETPLAQAVGLQGKFIHGDIFTDTRPILERMLDPTSGLPRPRLMFCDGPRGTHGHASEIDEFVPMLRPGDYLAVHDWADSPDERGDVHPADVAWMGDSAEPLHWQVWQTLGSITRFWRITGELKA